MDYNKTVLVIKGASQYEVLRVAADLISIGFKKRGYAVKVIDGEMWTNKECVGVITKELYNPYAFIFSCQSIGSDLKINLPEEKNVNVMKHIKAPYIGWIFDHPNAHLPRLENIEGDKYHVACIDNKHVGYIEKYLPQVKNKIFLPHGGFVGNTEPIKYQERTIDIFCPGSCGQEIDIKPYVDNIGDFIEKTYNTVFTMAEQNLNMAVYECLEKFILDLGLEFNKDMFEDTKFIMELVDNNIRYKCKRQSVVTLLEAGYKVVIAGTGWDDLKERYPEQLVFTEEKMNISEVVKMMQNSKIVLNLAPTYSEGLHERLVSGLMAGAAVITPYNLYCTKKLEACESLFFFEMRHIENLPNLVQGILSDRNMGEKGIHAREYLLENDTWEKRGEEIVEYVENLKTRNNKN